MAGFLFTIFRKALQCPTIAFHSGDVIILPFHKTRPQTIIEPYTMLFTYTRKSRV